MSSLIKRLNPFPFLLAKAVDDTAVVRVLQQVPQFPLQQIESLVIENGHVLITLQIAVPAAKALQPVAHQAEQAVRALRGVRSARVILTAERSGGPSSPPLSPAPASGHTAIRMAGAPDTATRPLAPHVKHIIAVASGKGGVGKSTVAINLAVALRQGGLTVGVLDADIYGPSVPTMLGVPDKKPEQVDGYLQPLTAHGLTLMSMGSLVDNDAPMIWRGPMVQSAILQLLRDVRWGALDVLVLDMPPGTGDAQLTVAQKVPLKGAVIVSTPQDIAWLDATKGVAMFRKVGVPVIGVVENMSQFCCPHCHTVTPLFGPHQGAQRASALETAYLGDIPLDPELQQSADHGTPLTIAAPNHVVAQRFTALAQAVVAHLKQNDMAKPSN